MSSAKITHAVNTEFCRVCTKQRRSCSHSPFVRSDWRHPLTEPPIILRPGCSVCPRARLRPEGPQGTVGSRDRKTLAASDANYRYWRILPIASAAAFSPFPPFIRPISNACFGSNSRIWYLGQLRAAMLGSRRHSPQTGDRLAQLLRSFVGARG